MKCKDCFYWVMLDDRFGGCKRYPQLVNKHLTDWCGEFKAVPVIAVIEEPPAKLDVILTSKRKGRPPKA